MRKGRGFQIIGSFMIAYIIRSVLIAFFGFPALSYARVYACIVCILMIINSPGTSASTSGGETRTVREEWIIDGLGNRSAIFVQSRYPGVKLIEKTPQGNIYSTNEGELITTTVVTRTIRSGGSTTDLSGDSVAGWAALVLAGCIISFLITGIGKAVLTKFNEAKETAQEVYEASFGGQAGEADVSPDDSWQYEEPTNNDSANDAANEETYVEADDGSDETYEEDPQDEYTASLINYGIYHDGHGISPSDYVLDASNKRKLTDSDTDQLTLRGINYAKNELYARHGRKFQSKELRNFFDSRDWYNGTLKAESATDKIIEKDFNSYEKYNLDLLVSLENSMGMYKLDQ